jgi:hypothetical protein
MVVLDRFTWVIGDEPDDGPSSGRHRDGVPLLRVDEVEPLRRLGAVTVVAEPLRQQEEVEPVQVHRVALAPHQRRVLQHHLHRRVVPDRLHLRRRAPRGRQRVGSGAYKLPPRRVRVVERHGRTVGKVRGVHAARRFPVPRVEQGEGGRERERLVVHARPDHGAAPVARRLRQLAGGEAQPDGHEHAGVYGERHGGHAWTDERRQAGVEPVRHWRVRRFGHGRQRRRRLLLLVSRRRSDVLYDGRGDVAVEASRAQRDRALVRRDRHVVAAGRRVGRHERVNGLPRRDHDHVRMVRRGVAGVRRNDGERVPRHLEEELRVERGVDDPQQVGRAAAHLEPGDSCTQPKVVHT